MPVLHQLVAGFRQGDAISDEACLIRDLCSAHGLASDIRCPRGFVNKGDLPLVRDAETLPDEVRADDVALLHLSSGSLCNRIFANLPCRRILLYHNITPPRYFERLAPATARILEEGLRQAAELRDATDEAWADSSFNASELRDMGYRDPKVLPLLLKDTFGRGEIAEWRRDMLSDPPLTNLLFVGRLVPNKRLDRLIAVFGNYQRYVNPMSRLVIVGAIGGAGGSEAYRALLLGNAFVYAARNVLFTDFVDDANLRACYASASAFVCMSDHEGFCAPLLEAMAWHVPGGDDRPRSGRFRAPGGRDPAAGRASRPLSGARPVEGTAHDARSPGRIRGRRCVTRGSPRRRPASERGRGRVRRRGGRHDRA